MTGFEGLFFAVPNGLNSERAHIFGLDNRSLCGRLLLLFKDPTLCDPVKGDEKFQYSTNPRSGDCAGCWHKAKHPNAPPKKTKPKIQTEN